MEELDQETLKIAEVDVKKIRSALTKATGKNEIAPNDKQTVHITINNSGTLIIQGDKGSTNISTSSKGVDIKMEVRASLFSEAIRFRDSGKVLLSLPSVIKNTLVFEALDSVRNFLHGLVQKAQDFKDSIAPESKEVEVLPPDSPDDPSAITPNSEVD